MDGLYDSVSGDIVIPAWAHAADIWIQIDWAANAVGIRQIITTNNGGTYDVGAHATDNAVSSGAHFQQAVALNMAVSPGMRIGAFVLQTSGGALNCGALAHTWVRMQVYDRRQ